MKPVLYNDVLAAVSYVASLPVIARKAALDTLLGEAEYAGTYAAVHGVAHPAFGDGTLMAAALRHRRHGTATFQTRDDLTVWIAILTALRDRHDL